MRHLATAISAAGLLFTVAPHAHADLITNGSFETGTGAPADGNVVALSPGNTDMTSWTVVNNGGTTTNDGTNIAWIGQGDFGLNTPFGHRFLDLTGFTDRATNQDGVRQTIATVAGHTYAVTFDMGITGNGPIAVDVSASGATSQLFTDNDTTSNPAGPPGSQTFWADETFNFTATAASTDLTFTGELQSNNFIGLDNVAANDVTRTSPVPEPASLALLGSALFGFAAIRRRRRRDC